MSAGAIAGDLRTRRKVLADSLEQSGAPGGVESAKPPQVSFVLASGDELREGALFKAGGMPVAQPFGGGESGNERRRHDQIAQPQRGENGAREGADIDHPAGAIEALQGFQRLALIAELAIVIVLDDDRVDVVGLRLSLPPDGPLGDTARLTLTTLDFALPAVIDVPAVPDWADALAVLAEDGAERVGIRPGGPTAAAILREAVTLGVPVVIPVGVTGVVTSDQLPGVLNVLAGVAVALDGADVSRVTAVLAERNADDLLAIVASADPRAVRGRLVSVGSHDVRATLAGLRGLGLLEEDIVVEESST